MKKIKIIISFFVLLLFPYIFSFSQILQPVHWSFSANKTGEKEAELVFEARIDNKWHVYSQHLPEGEGPIATSFHFDENPGYKLLGETEEGKPISHYDPAFEKTLSYFEDKAVFKQKVEIVSGQPFAIKGHLEFMSCDNERCLPPEDVPFRFDVTSGGITVARDSSQNIPAKQQTSEQVKDTMQNKQAVISEETDFAKSSLWTIFLTGLLGGLLALITPCVFPMIPLTVSFFLNRSGTRAKAITNAFVYAVSIIVIYVAVGFLVSRIFGSDALREMTSNAYFNIAFFLLFIVFGISFLGAFEITLPSSWANKTDAASERGGWLGIFFMALTLVLVSFSCTGPIIGALLVQAAVGGDNSGPLIGMTGFAVAVGLPFGLFAAFPGWMSTLPKSGGWLNAVKVTLGFVIIAFSLKFLSNVDLAYHWGILGREVFLSIWIALFMLLGSYFLGKLKFSHDSDVANLSVSRLFFAVASFAFAIYMIPGLWGAPLKAISAFTPPLTSQDFNLTGNSPAVTIFGNPNNSEIQKEKKYNNLFKCPLGINCFFDYEEGMKFAKEAGKPVLLDFTGWSCVNCKKMEATVWSDPAVLKRLKEDYVLISLYIDDKTELPESEQYDSPVLKKRIKTIGNKTSDFQATRFKTNSQPFYVLLDSNETLLASPIGYTPGIEKYVSFLDEGKKHFQMNHGPHP